MMNPFTLNNKKILITGASSGIGRAIAIACAEMGAELHLTARNPERLQATLQLCNNNRLHTTWIGDLTNTDFINEISKKIEPLDGISFNAGIIYPFLIRYIKEDKIQEVFQTNYNSTVLLTSALFREKKISNQASLVYMSSISSQHPYNGGALYVSTKAALEAFAKSVALEYASKMIRSNFLQPAMVRTPIFEQTFATQSADDQKNIENQYPLGFGETVDVANAVIFLLSNASRWITGQGIVMDGGLTLGSKKS